MEPSNVDIVRRLYRAMSDEDVDAAEDLLACDVQWIPDPRVGDPPLRGRDAVINFFKDRGAVFDELRIEPERLWETRDGALAFLRLSGRGRASGAAFEIRIAHAWTITDGLVTRGRGYGDRDAALRDAGVTD